MATFYISDEHAAKFNYIIERIDEYVNPRGNEVFERYNFLKRMQKEGESMEHFITDCRHLIKSCNYNTIDPNASHEGKALRDKIVIGIRDPATREAFLRIDQLTLDKTLNFAVQVNKASGRVCSFRKIVK